MNGPPCRKRACVRSTVTVYSRQPITRDRQVVATVQSVQASERLREYEEVVIASASTSPKFVKKIIKVHNLRTSEVDTDKSEHYDVAIYTFVFTDGYSLAKKT